MLVSFVLFIFMFAMGLSVLMLASNWKIYVKAGEPGWACLIPIYNMIVLLRIVGRPPSHFFFFLIPVFNFVFAIMLVMDLAKSFGQDIGFGIGMLVLPFIFYPILAFGDSKYIGPAGVPIDQTGSEGLGAVYVADEIAKLDQLFKDGVITFEEFEKRKKSLLGE